VQSTFVSALAAGLACAAVALACSAPPPGAATEITPALGLDDGGAQPPSQPGPDKRPVDGGYGGPDGSVLRADRFATTVVSVTYGDCAGFGMPQMPDVVLGPPVGAGSGRGSLDVVTLGFRGEIVLSFGSNAIVDGPGPDFLVFENAFWAGGDPERPAAELGDVSVSEDGVTWTTFPCSPGAAPPYPGCAGWRPVYASPGNGISPVDPAAAGGDPFDLAAVGLARARFVRIRDLGTVACPSDPATRSTTVGFDLDAVAVVNAAVP
jgi:hypothetical protein